MNKTKIKPKLILGTVVVILIFSLLPGALAAKSTKYVFDATEWSGPGAPDVPDPDPTSTFVEDGVLHIKDFWSSHLLGGKVGDDDITGYTKSLFHAKIPLDPETGIPDFGNMVLNGQTWFDFTWGEKTGYFTGTVNAKTVNGVLSGKFTLQGFGDFEGMKLFGIVQNTDTPGTNGLLGTILIPNERTY